MRRKYQGRSRDNSRGSPQYVKLAGVAEKLWNEAKKRC
jgi:hypothetical protein